MRELFVKDLVTEILGPRGGMRERLSENPLGEYITGVLAPFGTETPNEILEPALPTGDYESETDETDNSEDEVDFTPFAPVLSPQNRPFSLGVSFSVNVESPLALDLCVTWARYFPIDNSQWDRRPRYALLQVSAPTFVTWLDHNGNPTLPDSATAEISLHVRSRITNGLRVISIFAVNRVSVPENTQAQAQHHLFQPQIRVICGDDTKLVGMIASQSTEEDQTLQFLYRNRPVFARGHLTSAIWSTIDPEQTYSDALDFPSAAQSPPFYWIDGEQLDQRSREKFTAPDVRSEYVPVLSIASPVLEPYEGYLDTVEFRADTLASMHNANSLSVALQQLVTGYRNWIHDSRNEVQRLASLSEQSIGNRLLDGCDEVADRMQLGLDLLTSSEDVRLSFCFAMKAMALQYSWPSGNRLVWRPFQLAFLLSTLESVANEDSRGRETCDLLWVPTGGGKTEAYLAIIAFALALRRRRNRQRTNSNVDKTGGGVTVISRYTLRLLTIQQFRRTLKLITACEVLRVQQTHGGVVGWLPLGFLASAQFYWGEIRFSVGLWVGTGVAPNKLQDGYGGGHPIPGALSLLRGVNGSGEPAQVLDCPACSEVLAVPNEPVEIAQSGYSLKWTLAGPAPIAANLIGLSANGLTVTDASYAALATPNYGVLAVTVVGNATASVDARSARQIWDVIDQNLGNRNSLACASASRPGYFLRHYTGRGGAFDFDIACPNPECPLHTPWFEAFPAGSICDARAEAVGPATIGGLPGLQAGLRFAHIQTPFRSASSYQSDRVVIPAYTVDDQIYHRCPSVVIATVDKFARPAFEPRAAALFGNVTRHHCIHGYYRPYLHGTGGFDDNPSPAGSGNRQTWFEISPFDPPSLVLQDELHLIEGPLGSLVGIYETAVDELTTREHGQRAKYIASTATIRQATEQVSAVFNRTVSTFPPAALSVDNSFFVRFPQLHPLDDRKPGRLYVGACAPGRGPLTPLVRLWARLLQTAFREETHSNIDGFWTLAGYFNAIRELAGARALYRQDIPERLTHLAATDPGSPVGPRPLSEDSSRELSGRSDSTVLPNVLDLLNRAHYLDALFTTSMFGTGVDVQRLGLMLVNGQPKNTSAYIQATGRVGRRAGALVATFFRAARPRDLNHYEFFVGYHLQLHRFVEPITVMPFAPGAMDRALGPVSVLLLRNKRGTVRSWARDRDSRQMATVRTSDPDVRFVEALLTNRGNSQPLAIRPSLAAISHLAASALDDWKGLSDRNRQTAEYQEYADTPQLPVVLGDVEHFHAGLDMAFENAPQSLRDVEETCGFET
jgi:hypothetical protein